MRPIAGIFTIVVVSVLFLGCSGNRENFFHAGKQNKIIALQPLDDYNTKQLDFISKEIGNFYNIRVIILKTGRSAGNFSLNKGSKALRCRFDP